MERWGALSLPQFTTHSWWCPGLKLQGTEPELSRAGEADQGPAFTRALMEVRVAPTLFFWETPLGQHLFGFRHRHMGWTGLTSPSHQGLSLLRAHADRVHWVPACLPKGAHL